MGAIVCGSFEEVLCGGENVFDFMDLVCFIIKYIIFILYLES